MHPTVTDRQLAALENGGATLHNGRVIPIIRGGSGLEVEAVPDGGGTVTDLPPDPVAAVAPPASGDGDPVPEVVPEAPAEPAGFSPEDPAFIEAVQREAAALLHQHQAAQQPPAVQQQGQPVDLNEFLNPLEDNFGSNMGKFLADRDDYLLSKVAELLEPVTTSAAQTQQQAGTQLVDQFIDSKWAATDGKLTDTTRSAIRDLAPTYLGEMNQRYGSGPLAAQQALVKAADTIRAINKEARGNGAAANAAELAAVAANAGQPSGGTPALQGSGPAETTEEALARWKARNTTAPQAV